MSQSSNEQRCFRLRAINTEHLPHIADWYQDLDELALIESHLPLPVNEQSLQTLWQQDLQQQAPRTSYLYCICDSDGDPVGFTGLQDLNLTYGNGVLFVYIDRNHRRLGLALRAFALLLDMAYRQLRLHRVTTYVQSENHPSLKLINRIGFQHEGRLRESCFFNGRYRNVDVVGLLAPEWEARRDALVESMQGDTRLAIGNDTGGDWCWPPR